MITEHNNKDNFTKEEVNRNQVLRCHKILRNVSPYFDDFNENKNYHKVLFKPGFPVQARELTTLQSILQNQVEKFKHFSKKVQWLYSINP